jgi:creatinine amidohydrolase
MPVRELASLTYEDVRNLDLARTVALLPVGAIEAHGPHLPLGTDVVIGEAMARAGAERLTERGFGAVLLPGFGYTVASFAAAFPGTLSITASTVIALLVDLAHELERHGFAALAIANAHLDPAHLDALSAGVAQARGEGRMPVVFPNLARRALAARLTEEFRSGACHAGRFEGSIVMAVKPEWVREVVRLALPPNPRSLSSAIRDGVKTFEAAGGPRAYFGWPADATAEEGRATIATLGEILAEAVVQSMSTGGTA